MSDQRGDAVNGSPADPDLEDTVRRTPSERAPADHRPGDAEETVPDGSGEDLPEDDTVLREAPPTEADGDALVHEVPLSDADDDTVVACHLKFSELFVDRDVFDELCRQPIGWHQAFYDDLGAPVGALEISLPGRAWSVTGSINAGPNRPERLNLLEATLSKVTLTLTKLGVLVGGSISWKARGDEVEDLADFLGTLAAVEWRITDGDQQDLLANSPATEF